jgi:hypothetical protein
MTTIAFEIETYEVTGTITLWGSIPPVFCPRSDCSRCGGLGEFLVGVDPPDEFNPEPEEIWDGCDCFEPVPGTGGGGRIVFTPELITCSERGELTGEEESLFLARMGDRLVQIAEEAMMASLG